MAEVTNNYETSLSETDLVEKVTNLTIELQVAKESIRDLQVKLEKRELELRISKERHERSFRRRTRQRKASGLLNASFNNNANKLDEADALLLNEPLHEYILLTVCGYSRKASSKPDSDDGSSNEQHEDSSYVTPTLIHMVEGKMFVVGQEGATIGCGSGCAIKLPAATGLQNYHGCIKCQFNIEKSQMEFFYYKLTPSKYQIFQEEKQQVMESTKLYLQNGIVFLTGNIKWKVTSLPTQKCFLLKAFLAVRRSSIDDFKRCLQDIESWNNRVQKSTRDTASIEVECCPQKQIDINAPEDLNYSICMDIYDDRTTTDDTGFKFTIETSKGNEYSLLHVAVDFGNIEITKLLLLHTCVLVNIHGGSQKYTPLHLACKHDNLRMVELLLLHGACVDKKDSGHMMAINITEDSDVRKLLLQASMLSNACWQGDTEVVKGILKDHPVCLNVRAWSGYTPLQIAVFYGHSQVVKHLLKSKASVNLVDFRYKRSALHFSVLSGRLEITRCLLQHGADTTQADIFGYTPLSFCRDKELVESLQEEDRTNISLNLAVQIQDKDLVQHLLDEDGKEKFPSTIPNIILSKLPNTMNQRFRKTSQHIAMNKLGLGSLVDQKNERGLGPMHLAACEGNIEIIHQLYSHGGSIDNPGGIEKWSSLFYASLAGRYQCVEFLLALGANPDQCDIRGLHCVELVAKEISVLRVQLKMEEMSMSVPTTSLVDDIERPETSLQSLIPAQYLLTKQHCSIDLRSDKCLRIRLHNLVRVLHNLQSHQQKMLDLLKDEDEEGLLALLRVNAVKLDTPLSRALPITPLNYSSSMGLVKIVEILLTYNADPYVSDHQSYMPIHTAAECGYEQIVRALIEDGVDVNIETDLQKYTALHIAALKGHENVVKYLLSVEGIDITLLDANDKKAFQLCTDRNIQYMIAQGEELLYLAVYYQDVEKLKAFLNTGVFDLNNISHDGTGLLHIAATRNYDQIAQILIENGSDVNSLALPDSGTPLHSACRNASSQVADLLLQHGADLGVEDINGQTPFEVASTNELRKLLLFRSQRRTVDNVSGINADSVISIESACRVQDDDDDDDDDDKCRICLVNVVNTIVLPCGHQSFCAMCVMKIDSCSLDRRKIQNVVFINPISSKE